MKLPGAYLLAALGVVASPALFAADPANVDYTGRNAPFATGAPVKPATRAPDLNTSVQERRVTPPVVPYAATTPGVRPAPVTVTETSPKTARQPEAETRQPETRPLERSALDHRESRFQPEATHEAPQLVTRYQRALTAARAPSITSSPAAGDVTAGRVNRFVFRRNTATPPGPVAATAIPAGGSTTRATP